MRKFFSIIIIVLLVMSTLLSVPVCASTYTSSVTSYWDQYILSQQLAADKGATVDGLLAYVISSGVQSIYHNDTVCKNTESGLHESSNTTSLGSGSDDYGTYLILQCDHCNSNFKCYSSDLASAYDASVSEMPATGYSSTGGIYWYPTWEDCTSAKFCYSYMSMSTYFYHDIVSDGVFTNSFDFTSYSLYASGRSLSISYDSNSSCHSYFGYINLVFSAPISGSYKCIESSQYSGTKFYSSSSVVSTIWSADSSATYYTAGSSIARQSAKSPIGSAYNINATFTLPVYQIIPADSATTNNYYVNASRPTYNITYNLATVTNSGSYTVINNVYENQTVINEITNVFTNPSTGKEYEIDGWEYDYTTRKYTCNLVDGSLLEVTFGDAYVTVNLNGELEYYYYAAEDSEGGGVTGGDSDCDHDFALVEALEATCTTGGYKVYVCKTCGATYQDTSFAIGHDYQFIETVDPTVTLDETTLVCPGCNANEGLSYELTGDQTFTVTCPECSESWSVAGTLVAGYDLYRCANCGDEYHDSTGEGVTRDDAGYWAWLQKWLQNFKTWLGEKLDALASSSDSQGDVEVNMGDDIDYNITYTDEDTGQESNISIKDFIGKFAFVKDIWKIGRTMIAVVSEDAAYAYEFDPTIGNEAAGTDEETEAAALSLDGDADTLLASGSSGAPSFPINLSAANSVYGWNYGGEVEMLDLSWYTPYKESVDKLVGGFLWLFFMWKIFMKAPGIISGASMDASKAEDIKSGTKGKRR